MSDCFDAAVQLVLAPAGAAPGSEVPVAAKDMAGHATANAQAVARKMRFTEILPFSPGQAAPQAIQVPEQLRGEVARPGTSGEEAGRA
jgi:hypothetical protein